MVGARTRVFGSLSMVRAPICSPARLPLRSILGRSYRSSWSGILDIWSSSTMGDKATSSPVVMPVSAASTATAAATPKKATAVKSKKPRAKPTHPKTAEMVNAAIKALKERGGSSVQAIKKYIAGTYKIDAEKQATFIKKYLKTAVASGALIQTKGKGAAGSFKLSSTKLEASKAVKPAKPRAATKTTPKKAPAKKPAAAKKPVEVKKAPAKKTVAKAVSEKKASKGPAAKPPKAKTTKAKPAAKSPVKKAKPAAPKKAKATAAAAKPKKAAPKKAASKK